MKYFFLTIVMFFSANILAQEFSISAKAEGYALGSTSDSIPFWSYKNSSSQLGEQTNLSGLFSVTGTYTLKNGFLEAGLAIMGRDGVTSNNIQRRDLYLKFQNTWLRATLGSKQRDILVDGLSTTNKNYLWSNNARPLPGLMLEANEPLKITNTFGLDWGIAHYELNDDRFVENTRIHYKRLGLITTLNNRNKITARITHFAQWGGTSPVFGELRDDFTAFTNVFIANRAPEIQQEGEILNAVGNHLGTYFLEYELKTGVGVFTAYHEHPFEDGSGTRLANFPDGVWGITLEPENKKNIKTILYEYVDTRNQSVNKSGDLPDNYFSNLIYRSGWTYEGNIIGLPFFVFDKNIDLEASNSQFVSRRATAHHLGISGSIKENLSWKLRTTYVSYLGNFGGNSNFDKDSFYNNASLKYTSKKIGEFGVLFGADFTTDENSIVGGGITYSYKIQ